MADMAPATPNNEARRIQMLRAAAELICERGFGETRIADVAKRAEASSALVIYYFGTRERLLVDALRYSEQNFYDAAEKMLAEVPSARERLSLLVRWTCVPENEGDVPGAWGLWFDLWAQAFRHPEVKQDRVELDGRWRDDDRRRRQGRPGRRRHRQGRTPARSRSPSRPCWTGCRSRSRSRTPRSTATPRTRSRCPSPSANSACRRPAASHPLGRSQGRIREFSRCRATTLGKIVGCVLDPLDKSCPAPSRAA